MTYREKYKQYLKSEHWHNLRQDAWYHYGYRCFFHKNRTRNVEMHHINYRDWYTCRVRDLIPLCPECHRKAHKEESWMSAIKKASEKYWDEWDYCNKKKKKKKPPRPKSSMSRKQRGMLRKNENKRKKKKQSIKRTLGLIEADKAHYIIINKDTIKPLLNGGVALGRENAAWFGLEFPLPKGWMKELYGKRVLKSEYLMHVRV